MSDPVVATETPAAAPPAATPSAAPPAATPAAPPVATETPAAAPPAAEAKPVEGAPEKYEFKAPEGVTLDPATLSKFEAVAKELNLPQAQADKLISEIAPQLAKAQADALATVKADWESASKSDKEFGGDAFNENLAVAKAGLDAVATPALKQLLVDSGLGNHPEVIRAFIKVGKSIKPDNLVAGESPPAAGLSAADRLYATPK